MQPPRLTDISTIVQDSSSARSTASERMPKYRASIALIVADALAVMLSVGIVVGTRIQTASSPFTMAEWLVPMLLLVAAHVMLSAWRGMYPGYGICSIAELRSTFYTVTAAFGLVIIASFFTREGAPYERSIIILSWIVALPVVYAARVAMRRALRRRPWYGTPVVVIGELEVAKSIVDSLHGHSHVGLRPALIVVPTKASSSDEFGYHSDVPIITGVEYVPTVCAGLGIRHAIVAMPKLNASELNQLLNDISSELRLVSFVGEAVHHSVMWISNTKAQPVVHGDVEYRLRQPALRLKKRLFDLMLIVPIGIVALPMCLIIAALIKITSPGQVLFRQTRVGRNGRLFPIFKFRTMHVGAQERLQAILDSNEALKDEFERFRKLKHDPRITAVGSILRRLSLDELPQLWNVIRGDMSIVGIRPMLLEELNEVPVREYLEQYKSITPGLTGLWQASVRSDASFDDRVSIDQYYLYNWSLFLDIYILAKTFHAVLRGRGAY